METAILVFAALLLLVAALCLRAVARPDEFRVQRSLSIAAAPATIYPLLKDFRHWQAWSPYERLDPNLRRDYSGAEAGKGAVYAWEGNNKVGKGRMEIVEDAAPSRLLIKLDFLKPFRANHMAEFTLLPGGDTTRVTWAMSGRAGFCAKLMQNFFSMDRMVGRDFEKGLANLKLAVER
jgi:Polyketide cyclase / dehydrase and lipid transport